MIRKIWYALPLTGSPDPYVVQINLNGMIAPPARSSHALNLEGVEDALVEAFDDDEAKAVVLAINSPGGSPAQSRMILDRVRELCAKKKKPVITYIEDIGASGGYMIALSGDEVFADPFAIVGSIGVIAGGFGFHDAIARLGVDRRVYTAGESKSQLDPFKPEEPADVERLEGLLSKSHRLFIDIVKDRRGGRLSETEKGLFEGEYWLAQDALTHGLIDKIGDLRALLRERFGDDIKVRKIETEKKGLLGRLLGLRIAQALDPARVLHSLEDRSAWSRYGQ